MSSATGTSALAVSGRCDRMRIFAVEKKATIFNAPKHSPHGFLFGGSSFICSSATMAQNLGDWFLKQIMKPAAKTYGCLSVNGGCDAVFDNFMDLEYHRYHRCCPKASIPPFYKRNSHFIGMSWFITDDYARMLLRTDFGPLGPQDLMSKRKPYHHGVSEEDIRKELRFVKGVGKGRGKAQFDLFTVTGDLCNSQRIDKTPFFAGLPFFKNPEYWPHPLLQRIEVERKDPTWPASLMENVRQKIKKTKGQIREEQKAAKRMKVEKEKQQKAARQAAKNAAFYQRMHALTNAQTGVADSYEAADI